MLGAICSATLKAVAARNCISKCCNLYTGSCPAWRNRAASVHGDDDESGGRDTYIKKEKRYIYWLCVGSSMLRHNNR